MEEENPRFSVALNTLCKRLEITFDFDPNVHKCRKNGYLTNLVKFRIISYTTGFVFSSQHMGVN